MEDRDGKKPFIIPKTHTSNKDVLISEKTDSRNVTELFDYIKSCALEVHFDFRQNDCTSCDTIRNQKLQKLFNERRIQMKKTQDPTERFAFHLITSRDIALNIATDGLTCEQLAFSTDKYLGNPKDGIHLSRRPDVLLTSTSARGVYKFGLLICKILLGKGYATISSANNKELPAQLHYDHHFCKIQTFNKEQRNIDDILASSFIFCYEHEDLQTISHPSQILPLAILWYDLKEKFSSELTSISQESQQRSGKNIKLGNPYKKKPTITSIPKPILSLNNGTWNDPTPDPPPIATTPTKYPSQFMIPYTSLYTSFSNSQPSTIYRDPRLTRTISSSETIPLSPQNSLLEKTSLSKPIPLTSTTELIDPRLKTLKETQNIFYLEINAVKHALQQQKRLNNYHDSKNGLIPKKTSYTLIPYLIRSISSDEYERNNQLSKTSSHKDYSSLYISVIDCFHFGLQKSNNQLYIDLEQNENQLAYEQIKISSQLIQHEQQLNSQEIRLHLRKKRQRKIQEHINEQNQQELSHSKIYMNTGRKFLKEHQVVTSSNNQISSELLDFFSYEYRHETRPHVKRILAELLGIFVEKYGLERKQTILNDSINKDIYVPSIASQTFNSVLDMDLESSSSHILGDHDERFPIQTPPITESFYNQPLVEILSDIPSNMNAQLVQPIQIELPLSESNLLTDVVILKQNIKQIEFSSNENTKIDDKHSSTTNEDPKQIIIPDASIEIETDPDRSRDEFVKLLTKEAYILESPSSPKLLDHGGPSSTNDELNTNQKLSSTRTVTLVSNIQEDNLIVETATNIDQEKEEEEEEEPTVKRIKVDAISPSNDDIKSFESVADDHDYRHDLDERRRQADLNNKSPRSRSRSTSSHNSSIKESIPRSPPSSSSSSRASSINKHHQRQGRYKSDYEHNRLFDKSYHYHQQNTNNSISSHSQLPRHQRFNYNHQSVAEHPRFANIDLMSSPVKGHNQNSFSPLNNSQRIRDYHNTSPMTNTNRSHNSSYYNETSSNHQYYEDNFINNNPPRPLPLMSTTPGMNFTNSSESKPSNTIERLQMFLQDRSTTPYERRHSTITDYSSSSYTMNSRENSSDPQRSSSRYSSRVISDTNVQNNQTFTYTDAEQLLTFVQHLRN